MENIFLGKGVFGWSPDERRTDRYGSVSLWEKGESEGAIDVPAGIVGTRGSLEAVVEIPQESYHIGDIARGFSPSLPLAGDRVVLGYGTAFVNWRYGQPHIGLEPDDDRDTDWLNPQVLYRIVHSIVSLYFVPEEASSHV